MKYFAPGYLLAAVYCLGLLGSVPAPAAAVNHTEGVLGATDALLLVIDGLDEELAAQGLSRSKVEQSISSRLLAAGVQVVPENGFAAAKGAGVLTLRVRLNRAPFYFYMYNINLTLNSKLPVTEGSGAFTTIPTWTEGWVGALQPTEAGQLQGFAEELLTRFLAQRAAERGR